MKRTKPEITVISSESDEDIEIKREPYSAPEFKPGRLPVDENVDDIDEKLYLSTSAKRPRMIDIQAARNVIQAEVCTLVSNTCTDF